MNPKHKPPTPDELAAKIASLADGFNLAEYRMPMTMLRNKGFSLRETAAFLSAELGRPITHLQVYRMLLRDTPESAIEQKVADVEHDALLAAELRNSEKVGKRKKGPKS